MAINGRADKLCELLVEFEANDKKILATGEEWDLGSGFALTARQINLEGDKVWFSLYRDGKEIDSEVILCGSGDDHQDRVYAYTADIGGEDDVPVFTCYVDAIFTGTDSHIVLVTYVFLIDDAVLEISTGDRFGCMAVVSVSSAGVTLKNDDVIDLNSGTTIQIMDDLYFKTADDSVIRFYPFAERTIKEASGGGGGGGTYPPGWGCTINDTDGDGVPDVWDLDNSTPPGYWTDSDGRGRRWGDMNGDGKLTSVDAFMILQAAVGNLKDPVTGCNDLDQRVLRMYNQDEDGEIDANWMDAASIDLELNRITLSEYEQIKYAYEHKCPAELKPAESE